MRILFARAIDDYKTAVVIEFNGLALGGVAFMRSFSVNVNLEHYDNMTARIELVWEWWRVVDLDDFMNNRGWEHPIKQIQMTPKLEFKE